MKEALSWRRKKEKFLIVCQIAKSPNVSIMQQVGSRQLELSLYLQYDVHVQQAVDEKMTTRCRLQHSEKSQPTEAPQPTSAPTRPPSERHSAIFSIEKSSRRNEVGPPATTIKNVLPFRPLMNNSLTPTTSSSSGKGSGLPLTSYQGRSQSILLDDAMACAIRFSYSASQIWLF